MQYSMACFHLNELHVVSMDTKMYIKSHKKLHLSAICMKMAHGIANRMCKLPLMRMRALTALQSWQLICKLHIMLTLLWWLLLPPPITNSCYYPHSSRCLRGHVQLDWMSHLIADNEFKAKSIRPSYGTAREDHHHPTLYSTLMRILLFDKT
jgi:hypothetical protein